jgi:pancreatic lipase-related protein 1/phosphatidic acid-selective phospholipase A1
MWRIIAIFLCCFCATAVRAASVCCPGAGCFTDDPPFDGLPLPECAEQQNITMQVFTRNNPNVGQLITRSSIPPAYDGAKKSIFLVHGWLGSKDNTWLGNMKDDLLQQGDYNAIIVGWEGGSQQLWYPQSASDTRTVGAEIGLVAQNAMANAGTTTANLYCNGHSLGGHVCGHAGTWEHFGRITGMDPAGPLFQNRDWTCGLNPSCADLVDVLHTNGEANIIMGLGTMKVLGHVDFYPNGGGRQPECVLDPRTSVDPYADMTPACSHVRAVEYYKESILTPCFLSRYQCTDQYNLPGSCTTYPSAVQSMGLDAVNHSARGIFYLTTNGASPFCQG